MKRDVMDILILFFRTKNRVSFERKLKEYAKEIDKMFSLIEMAQIPKAILRLTRFQDAVAHFKRLS